MGFLNIIVDILTKGLERQTVGLMQYRSFASKAVGQLLVRAGPLRARKIFLRVYCKMALLYK